MSFVEEGNRGHSAVGKLAEHLLARVREAADVRVIADSPLLPLSPDGDKMSR